MNSLRHLLAALVVVSLGACATRAPVAPPTETAVTETAPAAEPTEPREPAAPVRRVSTRISVAAVGDMMIGTDYPENHLPDDDGVSFLAGVAPWLWSADVGGTRTNLEVTTFTDL